MLPILYWLNNIKIYNKQNIWISYQCYYLLRNRTNYCWRTMENDLLDASYIESCNTPADDTVHIPRIKEKTEVGEQESNTIAKEYLCVINHLCNFPSPYMWHSSWMECTSNEWFASSWGKKEPPPWLGHNQGWRGFLLTIYYGF